MESYDLRGEIDANGQKYYIQTHLVPSQQAVVSSLFHEGALLSKQVESFDDSISVDDARTLVKQVHDEKQLRIHSLLAIMDKLRRSEDGRAHLKLSEALFKAFLLSFLMLFMSLVVALILVDVSYPKAEHWQARHVV